MAIHSGVSRGQGQPDVWSIHSLNKAMRSVGWPGCLPLAGGCLDHCLAPKTGSRGPPVSPRIITEA